MPFPHMRRKHNEIHHPNFNLNAERNRREDGHDFSTMVSGQIHLNEPDKKHEQVIEIDKKLEGQEDRYIGSLIEKDGKGKAHYFYIAKRKDD